MDEPKYTKQTKTAEELQAMILEDLRKVDGCPRQGDKGSTLPFMACPGMR
jgi:hypothetical protein